MGSSLGGAEIDTLSAKEQKKRKLAEVRLWIFFLLLGMTLATAACSSSHDEGGSCEPGDDNYPECLED